MVTYSWEKQVPKLILSEVEGGGQKCLVVADPSVVHMDLDVCQHVSIPMESIRQPRIIREDGTVIETYDQFKMAYSDIGIGEMVGQKGAHLESPGDLS